MSNRDKKKMDEKRLAYVKMMCETIVLNMKDGQ